MKSFLLVSLYLFLIGISLYSYLLLLICFELDNQINGIYRISLKFNIGALVLDIRVFSFLKVLSKNVTDVECPIL